LHKLINQVVTAKRFALAVFAQEKFWAPFGFLNAVYQTESKAISVGANS